jgi:hypothetical protein
MLALQQGIWMQDALQYVFLSARFIHQTTNFDGSWFWDQQMSFAAPFVHSCMLSVILTLLESQFDRCYL